MIAAQLKAGDLVVFRSTVPVGTIRQVALPLLEKSGLSCGHDFYLAFAPERTVEGNALAELRLLPQIVGGYDPASAQMAARLFRYVTSTIIEVGSLEEAEMVKLINNTFRDLVFAFANETAQLCESMNVNAFDLIRAANEGYPRDRIPLPSPGVGGICLSKDPHLYSQPLFATERPPVLGKASRQINAQGAVQVLRKMETFANRTGKPLSALRLLLIGLAFKGMPETSDTRGSVALDLLRLLPAGMPIAVKDFVVADEDIAQLGYIAERRELEQAIKDADLVLVMNNHYRNNKFNVVQALRTRQDLTLFFDGWNQFDQREIEALPNICYATLGYMTPKMTENS
jgi:UDP-N-acetyl-D-mannosaminuronic acid dehydrogenase